jgi:hypothetical protein
MKGGYIAALVVAGLTLVGMFAAGCGLAVWGAVEGISDTDKYGRVQVPGKATLELPEGEVNVFFETATVVGAFNSRRESVGLSIVSESGEPVDLRGRGSVDEEVTEGDVTRVNFDRVDIPAAGDYLVTTTVEGKKKVEKGSALTFGKALTDGVVDRAKDALWGLLGFVLAAAIALVTLATTTRTRDESVTLPPPPQ